MEILGSIKTYDWGTAGSQSKVSQLALKNDAEFSKQFDESTPYAELWMGDHVSGTSIVKSNGQPISKVIEADNSLIGGMSSFPFLFKVLSVTKPLSIQIHPNKKQAEELHASRPDIYKDPNHKPEISIALTDFEALCGFRTPEDLLQLLKKYEPLEALIGSANIAQLEKELNTESVKSCYITLMHSMPAAIETCIVQLSSLLKAESADKQLARVFEHCNHHFPNDIGVLSIFFFNIVRMSPGQAIFLGANIPHAYLSGDCMECMACSDNVIRAGLTPKFKDVDTLLSMIDFQSKTSDMIFFQPLAHGTYSKLFKPPVKDFAVVEIDVPCGVNEYVIDNRAFGSIIIVLNGKASTESSDQVVLNLTEGSIVFIPATVKSVKLTLDTASGKGFRAYQALYNDF